MIFLLLWTHSGHSKLSSASGSGITQAGNRKRKFMLWGVSGAQVWPAWNCMWTQPFLSAGCCLPWTTHHPNPIVCGRKAFTLEGRGHQFVDPGWPALMAVPAQAVNVDPLGEMRISRIPLSCFLLWQLLGSPIPLKTILSSLGPWFILASWDVLWI